MIFTHNERQAFQALLQYLVGVIEHNRAHGIDPAAYPVTTVAETPSVAPQVHAQAQHPQQAPPMQHPRDAKEARRVAQGVAKYGRPDIAAAAARMSWKLGGGRELKHLAGHLHEGESVRLIAQGTYGNDQGILVLTDRRLLFLFHGHVRQAKEDFPLHLISSVQTKYGLAGGLTGGELRVFVSGNNASISNILKPDLEPLAEAIRQGMAAAAAPTHSPQVDMAPSPDPYDALQKLASLRDSGILSDEEFTKKKQEILDRM